MDGTAISDLFCSLGAIRMRKMFGAQGIYLGDVMFALEAGGKLYLKADAGTAPLFEAAGSRPFTYRGGGKAFATSYWGLPDAGVDDPDVAQEWARLALDAAARARSSRPPKRKVRFR